MAALPLQRGALAARVAHGGNLRGHREAGLDLTPGKRQRNSRNQEVTRILRVRAWGTAPLEIGFQAEIRFELAQQVWRVFTTALCLFQRRLRELKGREDNPTYSRQLPPPPSNFRSRHFRTAEPTGRGWLAPAKRTANLSSLPLPVRIGPDAGAPRRLPRASDCAVAVSRTDEPTTVLPEAGRGRTSAPTVWAALPAQG